MEHKVISMLNEKNSVHCAELIEKGQGENYQFIVMTLLGPSLDAIRATIPTHVVSELPIVVYRIFSEILNVLNSCYGGSSAGFVERDPRDRLHS